MSDEKRLGDQGEPYSAQELPRVPELPQPPKIDVKLPKLSDKAEEQKVEQLRKMGVAYNIPASLIAPIIVLSVGGIWLDKRFGGGSIFTAIGLILGVIVGFMNMIRMVQRLDK
jgi:F0F1-type ATP synthase assembly protein I